MTCNLSATKINNFKNGSDTEELTGNPRISIRKDIYNNFSLHTEISLKEVVENYPQVADALGICKDTDTPLPYNSKNSKLVARQLKTALENSYGVEKGDFSDRDIQVKFIEDHSKNKYSGTLCSFKFFVCNTKHDATMGEIREFLEPALKVYNEKLLTGKIFDEAIRSDNSAMGLFKRHVYGF